MMVNSAGDHTTRFSASVTTLSPTITRFYSVSCYPNKDAKSIGIVQICSVKSRVWKRIEDFKYGLPSNYPGKYVNNSLNWVMDNEFSSIVTLDLGSETYQEVMQPEEEGVMISHKEKTIGDDTRIWSIPLRFELRGGAQEEWFRLLGHLTSIPEDHITAGPAYIV
ncbi:hypothetical protein LINGRAHAP2_LOCUS27873 [Linum grandiflorum]